jgi:PAS domain S-box-containing protein
MLVFQSRTAKSATFLFLGLLFFTLPHESSASPLKKILILFPYESHVPGFITFSNAFQSALKGSEDCELEFFIECMDLTRFPAERHHDELMVLYREKYSDMKLDLIVASQFPSLQFLAKYLDKTFLKAPVLIVNIDSRLIGDREQMPDATVSAGKLDFSGTMALSMSIHPDARKVFVVSGASRYDETFLTLAREELHTFEDRVELSYLSGLPMDELIHRVSNLPEHSVVLFVSFFRDGSGKAFKSPDALALISRLANAPIYAVSETLIGSGIVGGNLNSLPSLGAQSARVALRILAGERPSDLNLSGESGNQLVFDARELTRWGISEAALPPGSTVIHKEFSIWESYPWTIAGILVFVLTQTLLIAGLLVNRGKRRSAELRLRESRTLLTALFDSTPDFIWSVDAERFGLLTFNRSVYEYFMDLRGLRIETGMRPQDLFPHEELVQEWQMFYRRTLEEGSFTREYLVTAGDRTMRLNLNRLERDGKVFGVSGFGQDITERKRAEEAMAVSEARYRTVADYTHDWEYWAAPDGTLNYVSPSCKRVTGYAPQEFIDSPSLVNEIIVPEDRLLLDRHQVDRRSHLGLLDLQFRILTREGQIRWIDHSCQSVMDQDGHFLGIRASNRDVTERKMAEARAQQHRDELSHVTRVAALGELTSSLAHELNQPLAAILNYANAAQRFLAGPEPNLGRVSEAIQGIIRDEKRAADVIRNVRALLRKQKPRNSALDINDVIRDSLVLFQGDFILKDLSLVTELAPGLPAVSGDRVQLQQVLINLSLNAAAAMSRAMPDSRRLVFRTELSEDQGVKFSVRDSGTGIDEDHKDRLFDTFYTTNPEGLGMGLAICQNIIDAHGGTIWAENNPDGGATFSFILQAAGGSAERVSK